MHHTHHALLDINNIDKDLCSNDSYILEVLTSAAKEIKANIIAYNRYHFGHNSPAGCTVFLMLDESHISAHTYSEEGKISIDVFTCNGLKNVEIATNYIINRFNTDNYSLKIIERFK